MTVRTSSMLPVRDQAGQWLELGNVKHVAEWRAWPVPATLPAWLVPDQGQTNTLQKAASGPPGLILTGTDPASPARIRMNEGINRPSLTASRIDVHGVTTETTGTVMGKLALSLSASGSTDPAGGVVLTMSQAGGVRTTLAGGTTTNTLVHAPSATVGPNKNRWSGVSLGLIVDWSAQQAWAVEGSDVVGVLDMSAAPPLPTQINPAITFTPGTAGDSIRIAAVRITSWYD